MKTSDLIGPALDWAVAKIEWAAHDDETNVLMVTCGDDNGWKFQPSTNWSQGGPILEREIAALELTNALGWKASRPYSFDKDVSMFEYGPTALVAAMRCFVSSKLGDEIEIPEEFL